MPGQVLIHVWNTAVMNDPSHPQSANSTPEANAAVIPQQASRTRRWLITMLVLVLTLILFAALFAWRESRQQVTAAGERPPIAAAAMHWSASVIDEITRFILNGNQK